MFWLVATILTAMVFVPLAMVMLRGGPQEGPAEKDIALYKDQLAEVDRDLARGTLAEAEAEAARAEVARRLLAADRRAGQGTPGAAGGRGAGLSWGVRAAGLATLAVALVGAVALYSQVGVPGYRDWPLAERLRAAQNFRATRPGQTQAETQVTPPKIPRDAELEDLVAQLRTAVADNPNDLRGLGLLARNEMRLGNFTRAHAAQARLIAALGGRAGPEEYTDLAEMMVLAADGYV
ncbi:MAG: c-type cytochrome biogenesis protein CcmI, partial [Pseudomonadota bacterium]